jgi:replicative DNA helicase
MATQDDFTGLHNVAIEQALLGALLLDNQQIESVVEFLKPEYFSVPFHARIYQTILSYQGKGRLVDPITLKAIFETDPALESLGGASYFIDLVNSVFSISSVGDYGRLIHELFMRRQLVLIGEEMIKESQKTDFLEKPALLQVEQVEKKLFHLVTKGSVHEKAIAFQDALVQSIQMAEIAYKRDSHVVGVATGFSDLDLMLGGLHPSDLVIVAGRPSMGKTAFATNMAFHCARTFQSKPIEGSPVGFFSLEMSSEQLASRIIATETGVSSDRIRRGDISEPEFQKLIQVSREIASVPLFIDETPGISIATLRHRARRMKRQHNIGLLVVDYLQLLEGSGYKGGENRVQEISEISRGLKTIAKELNIPVVALSQLSRAVEQREDKRPQLSDLRESGSIEQDADVVMFVYREEYYQNRKEPPNNTDKHREWLTMMNQVQKKAEIIIAKQRHGPIGTVNLFFDGRLTKFGNLVAPVHQPLAS